jgi:hypothetical protein
VATRGSSGAIALETAAPVGHVIGLPHACDHAAPAGVTIAFVCRGVKAGVSQGDHEPARSTGIGPSADDRIWIVVPRRSPRCRLRAADARARPCTRWLADIMHVAHRLGPYGSPPHILHMTVPATGSIRRRVIGTHEPHSQTGPRAAAAAARSCGPACPASAADSPTRVVSYS